MLTYESADVMHALFDRASSVNRWNIRAMFLKENLDYFSPKVEQLDIFREADKMTFISFTDKIVTAKNGKS
jgi:cell cycle checkpoint control protein RAD9A